MIQPALVAVLGLTLSTSLAGPATVLTARTVAALIDQNRQRIGSIYVELRQEHTVVTPTGALIRPWYEQTVALKGGKRYTHHRYPLGGRGKELRGNEILAETWDVWNGEACVSRRGGAVVITAEKVNDVNNNWYFDLLYYPHADPHFAQLEKTDYWLPQALLNWQSEYRLRSTWEEVDNVRCRVLERPGRDVLWIDPSRGCLVIRRELRWHANGALRERTTNRNYREIEPGLWLPLEQEQQVFCEPELGEAFRNKVHYVKRNVITKLEVNNLNDSVFHLVIPKGCNVSDRIQHKTYFTLDPAEDPWEISFSKARGYQQVGGTVTYWPVLIWSNLALFGILAVVVAYRAIPKSPAA